jgi:hypothetical protein
MEAGMLIVCCLVTCHLPRSEGFWNAENYLLCPRCEGSTLRGCTDFPDKMGLVQMVPACPWLKRLGNAWHLGKYGHGVALGFCPAYALDCRYMRQLLWCSRDAS